MFLILNVKLNEILSLNVKLNEIKDYGNWWWNFDTKDIFFRRNSIVYKTNRIGGKIESISIWDMIRVAP